MCQCQLSHGSGAKESAPTAPRDVQNAPPTANVFNCDVNVLDAQDLNFCCPGVPVASTGSTSAPNQAPPAEVAVVPPPAGWLLQSAPGARVLLVLYIWAACLILVLIQGRGT